jgi:hypothetical protein
MTLSYSSNNFKYFPKRFIVKRFIRNSKVSTNNEELTKLESLFDNLSKRYNAQTPS